MNVLDREVGHTKKYRPKPFHFQKFTNISKTFQVFSLRVPQRDRPLVLDIESPSKTIIESSRKNIKCYEQHT